MKHFQCIIPGPGALHPHTQGHPTPHLSVTHRENQKNKDFPAKMLWFSGCATSSRVRVRLLCFHLPDRARGFSKDSSRGFYPAAPYPMGILLVFGSSEGKATNPSSKPRLEVWDSRRGTTEKAKWFPEHPLSSGTAGLGSSPLWQRNSTPTSFPMQKIIWEQPDNSKWKQKQLLINQGPGATRKRCSVLLLKKIKIHLLLLSHWSFFTDSFLPFQNSHVVCPFLHLFLPPVKEALRKF